MFLCLKYFLNILNFCASFLILIFNKIFKKFMFKINQSVPSHPNRNPSDATEYEYKNFYNRFLIYLHSPVLGFPHYINIKVMQMGSLMFLQAAVRRSPTQVLAALAARVTSDRRKHAEKQAGATSSLVAVSQPPHSQYWLFKAVKSLHLGS